MSSYVCMCGFMCAFKPKVQVETKHERMLSSSTDSHDELCASVCVCPCVCVYCCGLKLQSQQGEGMMEWELG